jgi:hypothetical protein
MTCLRQVKGFSRKACLPQAGRIRRKEFVEACLLFNSNGKRRISLRLGAFARLKIF